MQCPPKRAAFRKLLTTVFFLVTILRFADAQTGYQNLFSGAKDDEYCGSVKLGGNYIVVGNTNSYSTNGATQILLSKYNAQGVLQWAKVISDPSDENMNYYATDVQASCADSTWSPIDSQKVPGTPGLQPMTCVPNDNSDFYISGYRQSNTGGPIRMVLIKTDNSGIVQWTRAGFTPNSSAYDEKGISVEVASNWDVFIVGHAKQRGAVYNDHISVARFTRFGKLRWFKRYKFSPQTSYVPYQSCPVEEMIQGSPIGITITGEYRDSLNATNPSAMVMRVGYYGNEYWRAIVPTRGNLNSLGDGGYDIIIDSQTTGNNFIITGYTLDNNANSHTYLFQLNPLGTFVGGQRLSLSDGGVSLQSYGQSLVLGNPKAKVMIAGSYTFPNTNVSNTYLLKSSYTGNAVYGRFYPSTTPNKPATESIAMYSDGDFIATNAYSSATLKDAIVVLPTINNGLVNRNCQADTLVWDTVNVGSRTFLSMKRAKDTVRTWPSLADVPIKEPDTSRCFYEQPPQTGCCGRLPTYQILSCTNNWATGERCYQIIFTIDTRNCPLNTQYTIWDPGTGGWVPQGAPITICIPINSPGFVTLCILVNYNSPGPPPYSCQDFLCMNAYLPPCGIAPGGSKTDNTSGKDDAIAQKQELNIYPNPTGLGSTALLEYEFERPMPITIEVTDLSGRLMFRTFAETHAGKGEIELPIRNLSAGTYLVNCKSDQLNKTIRLMIIR
jgi:hypothetical protein